VNDDQGKNLARTCCLLCGKGSRFSHEHWRNSWR